MFKEASLGKPVLHFSGQPVIARAYYFQRVLRVFALCALRMNFRLMRHDFPYETLGNAHDQIFSYFAIK